MLVLFDQWLYHRYFLALLLYFGSVVRWLRSDRVTDLHDVALKIFCQSEYSNFSTTSFISTVKFLR